MIVIIITIIIIIIIILYAAKVSTSHPLTHSVVVVVVVHAEFFTALARYIGGRRDGYRKAKAMLVSKNQILVVIIIFIHTLKMMECTIA